MFNRMSLADAQTLAIRKLLSKSAYDSNITPGPPLPKSHPSPALLAKLHIECSSLYSSARLLAKTPGASKNSSGDSNMEVCADLRRYLGNQTTFHGALSRKWLGVEAGEKGGMGKGGEAVAFLQWAKKELEELKDGGKLINIGNADKQQEERWKNTVADELSSVNVFYKYYKKMNDSVWTKFFSLVFPDLNYLYSYIINLFQHKRICNLEYLVEEWPFQRNLIRLPHPLLDPGHSSTHAESRSSLSRVI